MTITKRLASIYIDTSAVRPGTVWGYAFAFVSVGVAWVLGCALNTYDAGLPFITFLAAILITTFISGFGAGLLAVVLSTVAADYFLLPADASHLLQFGAVSSLCVIIIGEIRSVIDREQIERTLRESKDRLQLALDSSLLAWWQYDVRRNVVLWDSRGQKMLELSRDVAPFEEFVKRLHPDDREEFLAVRQAALDPDDPKLFVYVFRILRKDGKVRWVETHGLPYFRGAGPGRELATFGGAIQDVTERKEREEKEHFLMREVNHRAKNMLSVVDAVARQTAARTPEDFIKRFSERLQALSANQDLLVQNEWRGVEIKDLVRAQLAHFAGLMDSRIAVSGPNVHFTPASAQAVGLALHELATNAGKYGALSTDTGRLDICWAVDGDTFTMTWTEYGGPPVSAPKGSGFGSVVIQEMAERSVDGKVDLDYAPSGLTWRLTCPVGSVLGR